MKPEQFIREFGEKKAREVVEGAPKNAQRYRDGFYLKQGEWTWWWSAYISKWLQYAKHVDSDSKFDCAIDLSDLKRLVESLDLLKYLGGYERTKARLQMARKNGTTFGNDHLKWQQAIRDHESIYGGGDE